jgi:Gram-negative bacterial TonB protein C-terminal
MQTLLALVLVVAAAEVGPAPSPQPGTTQQQFDAASADVEAGRCRAAITAFDALERTGKIKAGSIVAAAIAVRKGRCLMREGRQGEGEAAIESGLPGLAQAGENFVGDIVAGQNALGDAAIARWDYAGATRVYQTSLALLKGIDRVPTLIKLAKSTAFDGGAAPLAYAQEGIDLVAAMPKPNKDVLAAMHSLHARVLLNQGQAKSAYDELKKALSLSGGLTSRTSLNEVSLRGDLATAAMQVGRKDDARLYLAYTGAGRIKESPYASAAVMDSPVCGQETGLRPEDVAVVEFSMLDDGSVAAAQAVHTRGGPAVAAAFGKAVSEWAWRPEDIAKVPAFYRVLTRVELRCSTALGRSEGLVGPLRQRFLDWAKPHLPALDIEANLPAAMAALRKSAAESASKGNKPGQLAALALLAEQQNTTPEKRLMSADAALSLVPAVQPPGAVINWLRIAQLHAKMQKNGRRGRDDLQAALALSLDPEIVKDAVAANTLRLEAATALRGASLNEAPQLLQTVALDDRLPEYHPLRQLAWLRMADRSVQAGDRASAQTYFTKTGLTAQQCALLGSEPAMRKTGVVSGDFPDEAMAMGFEGWVRLEYDIGADGKAAAARPIIAYPPMIFVDAAKDMTKGFRYELSFRPENAVACSAQQQTIRFSLPDNH